MGPVLLGVKRECAVLAGGQRGSHPVRVDELIGRSGVGVELLRLAVKPGARRSVPLQVAPELAGVHVDPEENGGPRRGW